MPRVGNIENECPYRVRSLSFPVSYRRAYFIDVVEIGGWIHHDGIDLAGHLQDIEMTIKAYFTYVEIIFGILRVVNVWSLYAIPPRQST